MFDIDIPNALYRGMQLDQLEVLGELRKSFEKKKATVEVLRVRHRPTDEEFCLKKMQLICDEDSLLMANELRVLYQLDHPHIVKLYGHFVDG
jgi:serine/threonine protein kinase